jgi:hypothetical protein
MIPVQALAAGIDALAEPFKEVERDLKRLKTERRTEFEQVKSERAAEAAVCQPAIGTKGAEMIARQEPSGHEPASFPAPGNPPGPAALDSPISWPGTRKAVIESISPSGTIRIRMVGWAERLRATYWGLQICLLLGIVLFHDSLFQYLGEQIGRNAVPFLVGVKRGTFW